MWELSIHKDNIYTYIYVESTRLLNLDRWLHDDRTQHMQWNCVEQIQRNYSYLPFYMHSFGIQLTAIFSTKTTQFHILVSPKS